MDTERLTSEDLGLMAIVNNHKINRLIDKINYLEKKVRSLEADLEGLQEKVVDLG